MQVFLRAISAVFLTRVFKEPAMNGPSDFQEVRSSISRSLSYRFLPAQRRQFGTGSWHRFFAIQGLSVLVLWLSGLSSLSPAQVPPPAIPITSSGLHTEVNISTTPPAGMVQYDITGEPGRAV